MKKFMTILATIFSLLAAVFFALAPAQTDTWTLTWDPPAIGGTPQGYVLEFYQDDVMTEYENASNMVEVVYTYGATARARVIAWNDYDNDGERNYGPWSEWSETWYVEGPPGAPSEPRKVN